MKGRASRSSGTGPRHYLVHQIEDNAAQQFLFKLTLGLATCSFHRSGESTGWCVCWLGKQGEGHGRPEVRVGSDRIMMVNAIIDTPFCVWFDGLCAKAKSLPYNRRLSPVVHMAAGTRLTVK